MVARIAAINSCGLLDRGMHIHINTRLPSEKNSTVTTTFNIVAVEISTVADSVVRPQ